MSRELTVEAVAPDGAPLLCSEQMQSEANRRCSAVRTLAALQLWLLRARLWSNLLHTLRSEEIRVSESSRCRSSAREEGSERPSLLSPQCGRRRVARVGDAR